MWIKGVWLKYVCKWCECKSWTKDGCGSENCYMYDFVGTNTAPLQELMQAFKSRYNESKKTEPPGDVESERRRLQEPATRDVQGDLP